MLNQRLRQLRNRKHLTLDQLASRSGINRGTIHRIESDLVSPRVETLEALCTALGTDLQELFRSDPESPDQRQPLPAGPNASAPSPGERADPQASFALLDTLLQDGGDLLTVLDAEGGILYRSPSAHQLLGGGSNLSWSHWIHPEDLSLFRASLAKALDTPDGRAVLDYRLRCGHDAWSWVRSTLQNRTGHPMLRGLLITTQVAPGVKEADPAHREDRLAMLLNALPGHCLIVREDGLVSDFQDLGPAQALRCRSQRPSLSKADLDLLASLVRRTSQAPGQRQAIYQVEVDGNQHSREARIQKYAPDEALVLVRDVTDELQQQEARINQRKAEVIALIVDWLQHSLHPTHAAMRLTATGASHQGFSDAAPESPEARAAAIRPGLHALLAFSNRPPLSCRWTHLNRLVMDIVKEFQFENRAPIDLKLELAEDLPLAKLDPLLCREAVSAILQNAIEALSENPRTIRIRTLCHRKPKALSVSTPPPLGAQAPTAHVVIEIWNDGPSPDPKVLPRLMDPFFTTKRGHLGVGLAIAHGIVHAHQGSIQAYRPAQGGAGFRLEFPVNVASSLREENMTHTPNLGRHTILIAEDEDCLRQCLCDYLANLGHIPLGAANGQEALDLFRECRQEVDLVLMDINMPVMDGVTAIREIRKLEPAARIVVSTGCLEEAQMDEIGVKGLFGFLKKPYGLKEILPLIERLKPESLPLRK